MLKSNYLVYDCETGGLEFTENPITQFACCVLDFKTLKEVDRWETFVKPYEGLKVGAESLKRTQVTMTDVNSGIDVKDFNKTLYAFMQQHNAISKNSEKGRLIPVGHNVSFDNDFITYALSLSKLDFYDCVYEEAIDTQKLAHLAWSLTGEEKINLNACCSYAGIKLTDAHGAMNDVEATCELLRYFMKKIRSKKGDVMQTETQKRVLGNDFFEFKCAKK